MPLAPSYYAGPVHHALPRRDPRGVGVSRALRGGPAGRAGPGTLLKHGSGRQDHYPRSLQCGWVYDVPGPGRPRARREMCIRKQ